MKRTWRQTEDGLIEIVKEPKKILAGKFPVFTQDRDFSFGAGERTKRARERHLRKLDIVDSIERTSSSGFSRKVEYDG